jgi:hypothetical protein
MRLTQRGKGCERWRMTTRQDSRAATEGGPYTAFVGAALRGGPAKASPKAGYAFFCRSPNRLRSRGPPWQTRQGGRVL